MSWICIVLTVLFILDALRLRGRLAACKEAVADSEALAYRNYRLIVAPGVVVDKATAQSAAAFAQAQGLEVLDLVPGDLPSLPAMELMRVLDPIRFRTDRFGRGHTAGHALLVTNDVLDRANAPHMMPSDAVAFVQLAVKLKRYACTSMDLAIVPGLQAVKEALDCRLAVLREARDGTALMALVVRPCVMALLVLAAIDAPLWGALALAAYHAQPLLVLGGQRLRPHDVLATTLSRSLLELWRWIRTVFGRRRPLPEPDVVEAKRPEYEALIAGGVEHFFEPRRDTRPLCDSRALRLQVSMPDLFQQKPGRFSLERCGSCGHIFQNPRLTVAGLNYYYKDFYDGLGEATMEFVFGRSIHAYLSRARVLAGRLEPTRWLDVGAGHGHFCCAARQVWPKTTFDGLDFSASIDEAIQRRWVDTGYRGLFPELAPQLTGAYDVVSMSHYLEHTRDPQAELAAARRVLTRAGYLLIEVPDPACYLRQLLGRFWFPWFQPQHQHFLSVTNLEQLLHKHGFEPVVWHRGEAHMPSDIGLAVLILLGMLAPRPKSPWQPPCSRLQRLCYILLWSVGLPLALLGWVLDLLLLPVFRRPGLSNTYRVLAQRYRHDEN